MVQAVCQTSYGQLSWKNVNATSDKESTTKKAKGERTTHDPEQEGSTQGSLATDSKVKSDEEKCLSEHC